jgi:peptidoglycan/xylan/chitin deacetylase (PgdA/CDA1 family)
MGENVKRLVALMYHALYRDAAELEAIDAEDRPYALDVAEFRRHLDAIESLGAAVHSLNPASGASEPADRLAVLITFDDGHASNHALAYPELVRRGWPGVFLVTSDFIGRRPGFCNWDNLREMANAGMTVGSHGKTHRFLDTVSDAELADELRESKQAIEEHTGVPVDCISFPGGRYDRRALRLGAALGLRHFLTSELGTNDPQVLPHGGRLRRVAIRHDTRAENLGRLLQDERILRRAAAASRAKRVVRGLLGNRLYHALYRRFAT